MAVQHARREQDEALAAATARATVRELASWLNTGRLTNEKNTGGE